MLQPFFFYLSNGEIVGTGACLAKDVPLQSREGATLALGIAHPQQHYYDSLAQSLIEKPEQPSVFHSWDWPTKTWLPNLAAAQSARKSVVDQESALRTFAPIAYDNALFDADAEKSRPRITGLYGRLVRGDGLPDGWVGWRDAANTYHWALASAEVIQDHLAALMSAIENREQALLVSAWTHKANIDLLVSVEEVLAYDINSGWPQ